MDTELNIFEERYREMSTEELLRIYVCSDLVEAASKAMQVELEKRGVTSDEIAQAKSHEEFILQTQDRPQKRSTKIIVNILGVLIATAILLLFLMFKKGILF